MRKSFLWFFAIVTVVVLALVGFLGPWKAREPKKPATIHDWVFAYYMSYDNNLEYCGPAILDGLEEGVKGSNLVVTVLSDDIDKNGLKRYTITSEGRTKEVLKTDNSASEEVVSDYLAWVANTYPASHYAVVFLNHGGRLDEMCLDERPGGNLERRWLSARLVGPLLRKFREEATGEVELLFLQQCGRGTLENMYNFRGTAVALMASQTNVGAPNTYYETTLKWLAKQQKPSGQALARQIMASDEHFINYVCVNGAAVAELPTRLDPVIETLLGDAESNLRAVTDREPCYRHEAETNYDLLEWLESAFKENSRSKKSLEHFRKWVREKLIVATAVHPRHGKIVEGWCGLSLWVPESEKLREPYRDYPIYQDCHLNDLWNVMYPASEPTEKR